MNKRPEPNEYAPFYGGYVGSVEGDDVLAVLLAQAAEINEIAALTGDEKGTYAYAPGKWTIKEVFGHLIDGERVFGYRLLRIARGDTTPLAGFEQDDYVAESGANDIALNELAAELVHLRHANVLFLKNLKPEAWSRTGIASNVAVSARALAFIMAGHVAHHLKIVRERYLAS